jgi:hypothetical protein
MKKFLFLILFFTSLSCFGGTTDPSVEDSKYIEYGSKFKYVTRLCGVYNDDTQFCASAVLIDNHNFLTAAHVVKDHKLALIKLDKDKTIIVKKIIIHKDFNSEIGNSDIAIGHSDTSFNIDFYPELYENTDELNKVCCISGFGIHGTFLTGAKKSDNNRRAGSNKVDAFEKDLLVCSPTRRGSKNHTALEFLISSGDSGGGLFIDGKLAGINSCVMAVDKKPDSSYMDEGCHTRVSKFVSWIRENRYVKE